MSRSKILVSVAAVLVLVAAIRVFWPDGTISVDFTDAPLSKVTASIERQGRVKIVTNVPPETPVTLRLVRAPLMEALDTLAVRIDAELRPTVLIAPSKERLAEGLALFQTNPRPEKWKIASAPGGFSLVATTPVDARRIAVTFEPAEHNDLQSALRQISIKSGLLTAVPDDWNPPIATSLRPASASEMLRTLTASSKSETVEVFLLLTGRGERGGEGTGRPPGGEGPGRMGGGPRGDVNPQWTEARVQATIAQLPPEERPAAQADVDTMRAIWKEVSALPEDQRREKMAEIFSRPEVQERMEERQAARDAKRTPEQRERRMKDYIARKKQAQAAGAQPR